MQEGSGSAAARAAAPDGVRVNQAVLEAAEELGRDAEAMEQVRRLGRLASAAAKNEAEAPALRAAAKAVRRRATMARTSRSSSTKRSSTRRGTVRTAPRTVRRCEAH